MTDGEKRAIEGWHAAGGRVFNTVEVVVEGAKFVPCVRQNFLITDELLTEYGNGAPKEPGFYWVMLNEPDGPPEWEVGKLDKLGRWWLTGSHYDWHPPVNPLASNSWRFGSKITR